MVDIRHCAGSVHKSRRICRRDARWLILKLWGLFVGAVGCVSRPPPGTDASQHTTEAPPASPAPRASSASEASSKTSGSPAAPQTPALRPPNYSTDERRVLIDLARAALERAVRAGEHFKVPAHLNARLLERKGCFVTLTKQGQLRGCIGNIFPDYALAEAVAINAYRAALNDPRFSPVTPEELSAIEIEVSVLSVPEPLAFNSPAELLQKLRPHVDGVVFKSGLRRSTFLPQVWEKLETPTEFLEHLAVKAGMSAQAWREPGVEIQTYQAEAFSETEPKPVNGG